MSRFPNWSALDEARRHSCRSAARPQARALNHLLNDFALITPTPARAIWNTPLGGLPYAAKDLLQAPIRRPACGMAENRGPAIDGTSDVLQRLDDAGGDLVGFTNMTELAYDPSGYNAARGPVRNPWNLDFICGGSSSGSAAAVASGTVVAALGSDTGGSLRIPAHACGVTAWKPTHGLVSARGSMPLAPTLDSIGLLARSADDMMPLVPLMADVPAHGVISCVALVDDVIPECDPAIRRAMADLVEALSGLGISVARRSGLATIEEIDRHALTVLQGESARVHRSRIDDTALEPALRRRLAKGLEIGDATLAESVQARAGLLARFEHMVLGENDAAVLPVMAITTPSVAECNPVSDRFSPKTLYALSRFTRFVNMLGAPAVALPIGFDHRGLPIAAQIVGRWASDLALLDLARRMQAQTDWHARVPAAVADLLPLADPI